jgi:uncharacterized C2H2 Zn-finger protein
MGEEISVSHKMFDRPVEIFLRQPLCGKCGHELVPDGEMYGSNPKYQQFKCNRCDSAYQINQYEWPHLVTRGK